VDGLEPAQLDGQLALFEVSVKAKRIAISVHFIHVLDCPSKEYWKGGNGAIHSTISHFKMSRGEQKKVRRIFERTMICIIDDLEYAGDDEPRPGHPVIISSDSIDCQIIADHYEDNFGIALTKHCINDHRIE